ncbi:MAG: trimethylamine methyltransferase family protein [Rhodospirillales bacterium]
MNAESGLQARRGGRAARKALRSAPLPDDERVVHGGLEGGLYKPLTDDEVLKIHRTALDALETVGLAQAIPSCVELFEAAGAKRNDRGRLCIPRALVEDTLANCARNFPLHGFDPKHDLEPWGNKIHFGTAGAAVHIHDHETGTYRESYLKDLYDIARIVDAMDNIHFFQRSIVARDMEDGRSLDINSLYAAVSGTSKHVGVSMVMPEHVSECLEMLHVVAGGEDKWRERPFVSQSNCFVVPPFKFAEDACACLESAVRGGMPVLLLSAGQAGATAPAALAGAVMQAVAECLAGLVYVNLIKPGAPAIFGTWPFVSDLRTGAMSGGSGEQALLSAACAQMGRFYDLCAGVPAGMTDAKTPDAQHGYEKGYTETLLAHAGANMIYESAGMQASLLGFSMEALIIDNDMIGGVLRTVKGIEVTEDSLSLEALNDVCTKGPGHYLGHDQTLRLMQTEYEYPTVGDRKSPKEWAEANQPVLTEVAHKRMRDILASHFPAHVSDDIDAVLRANHDIRLPRSEMKPAI